MLRYCANLKAIRYESTSLNRIVADKSHRVIVALHDNDVLNESKQSFFFNEKYPLIINLKEKLQKPLDFFKDARRAIFGLLT